MSQRTAQANKVVEAAWKKEQKRVKEGKGTRDWSQQEQKDILEKGKAYDEDGKAYEEKSIEPHMVGLEILQMGIIIPKLERQQILVMDRTNHVEHLNLLSQF